MLSVIHPHQDRCPYAVICPLSVVVWRVLALKSPEPVLFQHVLALRLLVPVLFPPFHALLRRVLVLFQPTHVVSVHPPRRLGYQDAS